MCPHVITMKPSWDSAEWRWGIKTQLLGKWKLSMKMLITELIVRGNRFSVLHKILPHCKKHPPSSICYRHFRHYGNDLWLQLIIILIICFSADQSKVHKLRQRKTSKCAQLKGLNNGVSDSFVLKKKKTKMAHKSVTPPINNQLIVSVLISWFALWATEKNIEKLWKKSQKSCFASKTTSYFI